MSDVKVKGADEMYCSSCGSIMKKEAELCPTCFVKPKQILVKGISEKSRLAASLICFFLGLIGVHRFYTGKIGTGILMILTFGGWGIWWLIDLIMILSGAFRDIDGRVIKNWHK